MGRIAATEPTGRASPVVSPVLNSSKHQSVITTMMMKWNYHSRFINSPIIIWPRSNVCFLKIKSISHIKFCILWISDEAYDKKCDFCLFVDPYDVLKGDINPTFPG